MASCRPFECLIRAEAERALADAATLENVRERHLASARRWEYLESEARLMAAARTTQAPSPRWRRSSQ